MVILLYSQHRQTSPIDKKHSLCFYRFCHALAVGQTPYFDSGISTATPAAPAVPVSFSPVVIKGYFFAAPAGGGAVAAVFWKL
jgi:hypothetical protein